jgi:hypothetical protein
VCCAINSGPGCQSLDVFEGVFIIAARGRGSICGLERNSMKFRAVVTRQGEIETISDLFPRILKEYRLEGSFTLESLALQWKDLVGEIIATHSMPDRIFKDVLFIAVDHPAYGNEIMLMQNAILQKIGQSFCGGIIRSIRTEVKSLKWRQARTGQENP